MAGWRDAGSVGQWTILPGIVVAFFLLSWPGLVVLDRLSLDKLHCEIETHWHCSSPSSLFPGVSAFTF